MRRVREDVLRALEPGGAGERRPARHELDRRRAEHERLAVRAGVRAPVDHEAGARPGPDDDVEERRDPDARAEAGLGERRRADVRLDDDGRRADRRLDVEPAPVDRVAARGPPVEVDELAERDPDRQPSAAELGGECRAIGEDRRPAAFRAGRHPAPLEDRA